MFNLTDLTVPQQDIIHSVLEQLMQQAILGEESSENMRAVSKIWRNTHDREVKTIRCVLLF